MATIDEAKLKKLIHEIVTELSYTVMPGYHTDKLFEGIHEKIDKADLEDYGSDVI